MNKEIPLIVGGRRFQPDWGVGSLRSVDVERKGGKSLKKRCKGELGAAWVKEGGRAEGKTKQ